MVTKFDLLALLEDEEPDYDEGASLGPEALVHLEALAREADPLLASKATYLASMIPAPEAARVLETAAGRAEPEVRVAAASGLGNLVPAADSMADADATMGLLDRLLRDTDPGVRKSAVRSAGSLGGEMADGGLADAVRESVAHAAAADPAPFVREAARNALGGM